MRTVVQLSNSRSNPNGVERTARRRHTRRLEILSAAARAFRSRGFAATGMREIAAVADLSPANLYHYFRGKHELLYFCQEASLELLLGTLRSARSSRQPAADQLRAVIGAHVRCVLGEMEGATAHLEVEDLPPGLKRRIVAKRDVYERGIRRIVAQGVTSGEFVACDVKLVTQAILGAVNWTARWYRPEGTRSPDEVGAAFAIYLVRGLAAAPAQSRRNGGKRA
jgi:AcrR family transcriptional regulator